MGTFKDLTGKKFGRLRVIKPLDEKCESGKHKRWICICDCGTFKVCYSDKLLKGDNKSCGCINHGKTKTRLYHIWVHMKERCYNPKNESYHLYGKRGIAICDEWLSDFMNFYKWSMAHGYSDELSIDRIDNNKGYYPDNCRWTTMKIQANNTRSNHLITYQNETKTLTQWAEQLGIKSNTLLYRLRRGWTVERAFTTRV